jgi:hypothetical protein
MSHVFTATQQLPRVNQTMAVALHPVSRWVDEKDLNDYRNNGSCGRTKVLFRLSYSAI